MEKEGDTTSEALHAQHKEDGKLLKQKDDEIASQKRLLALFTEPFADVDNDEVARLKRVVSRLLAKNEELRHGMSDDKRKDQATINELKQREERARQDREFDPLYKEKLPRVEAETIQRLSLRVSELEAQVAMGKPFYVITEPEIKKSLDDCTLLRGCFSIRASTIEAALDGMSVEERAKYMGELWSCWIGETYLVHMFQMNALLYKTAHDALYEKLTQLDKTWTPLRTPQKQAELNL